MKVIATRQVTLSDENGLEYLKKTYSKIKQGLFYYTCKYIPETDTLEMFYGTDSCREICNTNVFRKKGQGINALVVWQPCSISSKVLEAGFHDALEELGIDREDVRLVVLDECYTALIFNFNPNKAYMKLSAITFIAKALLETFSYKQPSSALKKLLTYYYGNNKDLLQLTQVKDLELIKRADDFINTVDDLNDNDAYNLGFGNMMAYLKSATVPKNRDIISSMLIKLREEVGL